MITKIPIFITARGNNEQAILRNKEALKYAFVYIEELNLFDQTYIISDNKDMLDYATRLGFLNVFHHQCHNESDISYLDYIGIYNFSIENDVYPDWFMLLALNQLFRDPGLIADCIRNIDNNYDVVASYTEMTNRSSFYLNDKNEIEHTIHLMTHERDRKNMVDASIYAIKTSFALSCVTDRSQDPAKLFWNGKIKYFKNNSIYSDIYNIQDIKKFERVSKIIERVKSMNIE